MKEVNLACIRRLLDVLCKFNLHSVQRGEVIVSKGTGAFTSKRNCKSDFLLTQLFTFYGTTNQNGGFLPTYFLVNLFKPQCHLSFVNPTNG